MAHESKSKETDARASVLETSIAEIFGTFVIVFLGTGSIAVDRATRGAVSHFGISVAFGVAVTAAILLCAKSSGAHLNPAVSVALAATRRFPLRDLARYAAAQTIGALIASAAVRGLFPNDPDLGRTTPRTSQASAFTAEIVATAVLYGAILLSSRRAGGRILPVALIVGLVVGLLAYFVGPISGASMNPARSLGPAIVSGRPDGLWIYLTAPFVGAIPVAVLGELWTSRE